jgi:TonB-dependent starch-binding outer membrane protein SusC
MMRKIIPLLILLLVSYGSLSAQKSTGKYFLTGTVIDANRKPVEGAMIFIDNKKTEAITDAGGSYKIKISSKNKTVSILTITGLVAEEAINGKTEVNFQIKASGQAQNATQNNQGVQETVNVGYGTMNKNDLTTSVNKIDGQNPKYASYKNIYDMIRGEVPGVRVVGNTISIQGPSSMNSGTQPLLVVNGMVVEAIDDIRPQSVKSIDILKGSAASIYGSRGANGVILITLIGAENK